MNTRSLILVLTLGLSFSAFASKEELSKSEIQALIGDFPAPGSAGEKNDDRILLEYQRTRSEAQCRAAELQSDISLEDFYEGVFSNAELEKLEKTFSKLDKFSSVNVKTAKKMYQRLRPYLRNKEIVPCIDLEKSFSYPSGHTTLARLSGRILSKMYPERAQAIMKLAEQAALNRVLGGVHHPSDIEAGKKLGDELALRFSK